MDLSVHEGEIPMPITSTYVGTHVPPIHSHGHGPHGHGHGHGHVIHDHPPHNHIIPSPSPPLLPSNGLPIAPTLVVDDSPPLPYSKKTLVTKYRECLKNHAASMGGNATDGCGEFMPSGEEGTIESLKCSACNCHRNFHRKDIEGGTDSSSCDCYHQHQQLVNTTRKVVGQKGVLITGSEALGYMPRPLPHHMIMSYNMGMPSESDEQENGGGAMGRRLVKKRFRTKFTQEQKEKMLGFAEKVGWRLQKQEEGVVQQFCQEIGVKRRVLKVWMHNNKHNLAKKSSST